MTTNDMTFKIGGEAGQGIESGGAGFAKALARGGLHVFGLQDYMSRVRGGHNFYQVRVSERPLYAQSDDVHLLLALVPETIARHGGEVAPGGGILYDAGFDVDLGDLQDRGVHPFPVPLFEIAEEAGRAIMANTAAFGAAAGVTGCGPSCPLQAGRSLWREMRPGSSSSYSERTRGHMSTNRSIASTDVRCRPSTSWTVCSEEKSTVVEWRAFDNDVAKAWCPGRGNHAIWNGIKRALARAGGDDRLAGGHEARGGRVGDIRAPKNRTGWLLEWEQGRAQELGALRVYEVSDD